MNLALREFERAIRRLNNVHLSGLSYHQVANLQNVSTKTVTRLVAKGELVAHWFGKQKRVKPESLARYIERNQVAPSCAGDSSVKGSKRSYHKAYKSQAKSKEVK